MALLLSLEGQWLGLDHDFSLSARRGDSLPTLETEAALAVVPMQQGPGPPHWQHWNPWEVPVVLVQYSQATSDKLAKVPLVPQSEHGAVMEAEPVPCTLAPREPSPDKEGGDTIPQATKSSLSSPDEAVAKPSHTSSPLDSFKEHQALLKLVAENLGWQIEEVAEEADDLFSVISTTTLAIIALPIHPWVLKIAKSVWQIPLSIPPTSKKAENKYYVPEKGFENLYTHPPTASLVVSVVNERDRQSHPSRTLKNKEAKRVLIRKKSLFDCQLTV